MAQVNLAVSRDVTNAPDLLRPVAADDAAGDFGSMLLDSSGLVFKCSEAAARILGSSVAKLEGSPIWSFIAGIMPSNISPSFNARYLAHLSATGSWRNFQATDLGGRHFPVELAMSQINSDGAGLFLLHLRRRSST
ncbi:MAG TPA: PAS domain-containing protein [Azonexus sp.]|nr:PAS domain-containing protein [Azonexus sp.]